MFNRILVALKFTPASQTVLKKGIELAKKNEAELHIFHALDYRLKELEEDDPKLVEIKNETKNKYNTEVEPLLNGFHNVKFGCQPADPALEICKIARHNDTDLIILGSHQRPEEKAAMGRIDYVGMTILEKSSCPVMLVPN
jgi:nucleotide-binding universal stress UspA family protein